MHCASDALHNSGLVLGLKGNGNWRQDLGKVRKDVQKAKDKRERQGGVKTEDPQWSDLAMAAERHGMEVVSHFSSTLTGDQMRQADFFELPQGVYMARLTLTRHGEQGAAKAHQKKHRRMEHHMIVLDAQDRDAKEVLDNDPTKETLQFTHDEATKKKPLKELKRKFNQMFGVDQFDLTASWERCGIDEVRLVKKCKQENTL